MLAIDLPVIWARLGYALQYFGETVDTDELVVVMEEAVEVL